MSGHSKWSTIKRQKGAADAARGQVFTKIANAIVLAVKQGGGSDPNANFKLRLAIDKAKAVNMPKDNIERAISRAAGSSEANLEEVLYEGFLPGGAAVLIEVVTDKKQRTVAEVKNVLEKNGGTMGQPGSVSYLFSRVGEITIPKNGKTTDDIINDVMDAHVSDFDEDENAVYLYVEPENLVSARKIIDEKGIRVEDASLSWKPLSPISTDDETQKNRAGELLQKLEDHDDVQKVYTNLVY